MEDILYKTEYNDLFEKFMVSMKDELYLKFNEFLKNNNLKAERNDEEADIDQITPKKKGRGRPKKNIDDNQDDINKPKKRGRGRPKKDSIESLQMVVVNDTDDDSESKKRGRPNNDEREVDKKVFVDLSNDDEDDETTDVVRIEIEGSIYLRDGTNKLYNMSDQEYVGVYDEVNGTIVLD